MIASPSSAVPLEQALRHLLILASAGSGKTFQLTNRFLALLVLGAEPASLLAATFTRLAAGEIRDRVLTRLAVAAMHEDAAAALARELSVRHLSADACCAALDHLIRSLHRLQIRTLDGFFASVVSTHALELEFAPGSRVIDESEDAALRTEAIALMLDESEPQKLIDLLRQLTEGDSGRGVTDAIDKAVAALHQHFLQTRPEAWERIQRREALDRPALTTAIAALDHCNLPEGAQLITAFNRVRSFARNHDWSSLLDGGLGAAIAFKRAVYSRKRLDDDLLRVLRPVVNHAVAALANRLREQTLATRDLLVMFDRHYRNLKLRRRCMTFNDLALAMTRAIDSDLMPEIYFRLDARLQHLLLDEMQDTSINQWWALRPLAEESVSQVPPERSFFCVGDVKQSIYGWREACPEVLESIPELLHDASGRSAVQIEKLAVSWRSAPVIMEVVNTVFTALATNPALEDDRAVAEVWDGAFEAHHSAKKLEREPGYVELWAAPRPLSTQTPVVARLRAAAQLASDLHRRWPDRTIALLTRRNSAVGRLLFELGPSRLNIPSGARGGGPLTDAAPVNAILDLFRLADHPDDTVSAFNVARSPLGQVVELTDHADRASRLRASSLVRRTVLDIGFAGTIAAWLTAIAPQCDRQQLRRLTQLVSLAERHDQSPAAVSLRCDGFVRLVERVNVADVRPAPAQVMTIHQSKGLEFDIVILPELDWRLANLGRAQVLYGRDEPTGPISFVSRAGNDLIRQCAPEVQDAAEATRQRIARDSLSVLYVAMTRAKRALHMIIDPLREDRIERHMPKTAAGILRTAFENPIVVAGERLAWRGDEEWGDHAARDEAKAPVLPGDDQVTIRLAPSRPAPRRLALREHVASAAAPSAADESRIETLAERLSLERDPLKLRGVALHKLFEQIEWLEEFDADRAALIETVRLVSPRAEPAWAERIADEFLAMIAHADVRSTLARGQQPAASLRVLRERPFARLTTDAVQSGLIDRIVIELDPVTGRPGGATIIDFKTDQLDAAAARDHAQRYRGQLEAYREAAAELLQLDPNQISLMLLFVSPGVSVPL
jgi:ATP-dependent exoDNAse (exonuclease V) beta subunit